MSEERQRILGMLSEGKITAAEAETLLDAMSPATGDTPAAAPDTTADWPKGPSATGTPKFMYVKVISAPNETNSGKDKVDVKIPLSLLRAGLKLTSLIPPQAMDQISESMGEHGMSFDFNNLKPADIEEIIANLGEMEVNVDSADGDHIRVFCA